MAKPEIVNRRKLIRVSPKRILNLIFASRATHTYVAVPHTPEIPEDVTVLGVNHDYARNVFVFNVCHESFDEVPDGIEAPLIDVTWTFVELARPEGKEKP